MNLGRVLKFRAWVISASLLALPVAGTSAFADTDRRFFDVPVTNFATPYYPEEAEAQPFERLESLPIFSASVLLGSDRRGTFYEVSEQVTSDGRFYVFHVVTDRGAYQIRGMASMRKHLQELKALDELKERSRAAEVAKGAGDTLMAPIKSAVTIVTKPMTAAKNTMGNARSAYSMAKRMGGKLKRRMGGKEAEKLTVPEREKTGFVGKMFGKTKTRIELARALEVDPYTHYLPLKGRLNQLASFHAAGEFGTRRSMFFIPGVGSMVVSGLALTKPVQKDLMEKTPRELARINRQRLRNGGYNQRHVKRFVTNPIYTPTEKTVLSELLAGLTVFEGRDALLAYLASVATRHQASSALVVVGKLVQLIEPYEAASADSPGVVDRDEAPDLNLPINHISFHFLAGQPVVRLIDPNNADGPSRSTIAVIGQYDYLAWTWENSQMVSGTLDAIHETFGDDVDVYLTADGTVEPNARKALKGFDIDVERINTIRRTLENGA
ncbi:MAG: hypothetical protein AAGE89_06095 [Pseudomonadota bacterium]